ncbi:MAG: hypothetical protein KAX37_06645 [Opitutaceae bacterium]|nr:hypothetical protein [Opitutaceae bacterium]
MVELNGQETVREFLTNNFEWSPATVADPLRCRRQIEVYIMQIIQTLQLRDFMRHNTNSEP